jgi:hypothetical protein
VGAWGYIGITGVSCAVLEFSFRRTIERFVRLMADLEYIFQPSAKQDEQLFYGYDDAMQPVNDPAVPVAYDVSGNPVEFYGYDADGYPVYDSKTPLAYDVEGNPVQGTVGAETGPAYGHDTDLSHVQDHREETGTREETINATQQTHEEAQVSHEGTATTGASSGNSQRPLFNDEEVFQNGGGRRNEKTQLKDVIGKPGERISMTEAMAEKVRYWVDPDSLEIWDRDYRRILFPGTC